MVAETAAEIRTLLKQIRLSLAEDTLPLEFRGMSREERLDELKLLRRKLDQQRYQRRRDYYGRYYKARLIN
jgi:hypothetical protein